eukprot:COSAG02_NODE_24666_length_680_cov_25.848537_1_plen_84_part_00
MINAPAPARVRREIKALWAWRMPWTVDLRLGIVRSVHGPEAVKRLWWIDIHGRRAADVMIHQQRVLERHPHGGSCDGRVHGVQ